MENIIQNIIKAVSKHAAYRIDFTNKNLKVGNKDIVLNGVPLVECDIKHVNVLEKLDELYQIYKHSVPSTNSTMWASRYFKALPLDELSEEDLMCGESRTEARIRLEVFFLMSVLSGRFRWDKEVGSDKFFYQSPNDKDLVLLRDWA